VRRSLERFWLVNTDIHSERKGKYGLRLILLLIPLLVACTDGHFNNPFNDSFELEQEAARVQQASEGIAQHCDGDEPDSEHIEEWSRNTVETALCEGYRNARDEAIKRAEKLEFSEKHVSVRISLADARGAMDFACSDVESQDTCEFAKEKYVEAQSEFRRLGR
jgi:hypothetical protein